MNFDRNRDAVTEQYANLARDYESRWSSYVRATTDATLKRMSSAPGVILDIGCGTGVLLSRLVEAFPDSSLAGVDASAEMLELARTRLPAGVSLQECWAEELPFGACSFDTVLSCNMFHFIRRPDDALTEIFRVLRPGGTVIITDWCDDYVTCKLCDLYLRWFDSAHFRMYGASQCRELLVAANARQIDIEKYKVSWLWGMMTATARKCSDASTAGALAPLQHAK